MKTITIHTDGAARGNPGPSGVGVVLSDEEGNEIDTIIKFIGSTTNNQAEYQALLLGLERALVLGASDVAVFTDSELMTRQIQGVYKVKNEGLRPQYEKAIALFKKFKSYSITHIRREYNKRADSLANEAIDSAPSA